MSEIISSDDLYDFGAWVRDDNNKLEPTSAWTLIMRNNVEQQDKVKNYNMTDEKAAVIDKAVCHLAKENVHLRNIFVQHYVLGMSYRQMATVNKCSKSIIGQKLAEASGRVIGRAGAYYDITYKKG